MQHSDAVMLCGSCFTENIGNKMSAAKINTCMNPQGILFNPMSLATCMEACMDQQQYHANDVFLLNELWHHWDFHSRFSNTDKDLALADMNHSIATAHHFLKHANWLILTFGSSFQYFLSEPDSSKAAATGVGNCHKAPGTWFEKRMLTVQEMQQQWAHTLHKLHDFNPGLQIIFTVSPVRHFRDGLVANNLSKARLFELVHHLIEKNTAVQYFPAFEIVHDVLRDYRFFEQDMVHPNQLATQFVWEQFKDTYFGEADLNLMHLIGEITSARSHKPRFKETQSHQKFEEQLNLKIEKLKAEKPYLDFEKEEQAWK
jgi:hypothetical protein